MINLNIEEPTDLIMTNDNIEKPSNDITNNKDPSTPAGHQFQCEICEFKCKYMQSFKRHMLNKHSKIHDTDESADVTSAYNDTLANIDSVEVTPAKNDQLTTAQGESTINNNITEPNNKHPTNPTTSAIYYTTIEEIDQICFYFEKGICKYGDLCRKRY